MKRETQNVLLLLLGLAVGVMVVKGAYLHYVKPSLLPWLLIVALGFLTVLSLVCIVRDIRKGGAENPRRATATAARWCGCCWCRSSSSRL